MSWNPNEATLNIIDREWIDEWIPKLYTHTFIKKQMGVDTSIDRDESSVIGCPGQSISFTRGCKTNPVKIGTGRSKKIQASVDRDE